MTKFLRQLGRKVAEGPAGQTQRARDVAFTIVLGVIALGAIVIGSAFGNVHSHDLHTQLTAWIGAVVFLVFAVMVIRRLAAVSGHLIGARTIAAAGNATRLLVSVVGYVIALFATFGVLDVSFEHLLVGGALTGVVLGIAAQQSLGNVFAGIVLLFARSFSIGDHIRIRSGALGGAFDGVVMSVSLTYVTLYTGGGPLKVPNSAMLAAAVGPYIEPTDEMTSRKPPDTQVIHLER